MKLSAQLESMAASLSEGPITFGEVVRVTQGRAYDFLLILLALPFLSPLPIPLLSTFLGTMIALIGARLAFGMKPWLPEAALAKEIHGKWFVRMLLAGSGLMRRLESLLRPRLAFVHRAAFFQRLSGALITTSGLLLLLPLPVPLSNFFPAVTVLILAASTLERDGAFFIVGCTAFTITLAFFTAIGLGGKEAVDWLWHLLPDGSAADGA